MRFPDHKSEEIRQNNRMLLVGMDSSSCARSGDAIRGNELSLLRRRLHRRRPS